MDKVRRFTETACVFFLGNIFTKIISFFLLPLYTGYINPEDFGKYGLSLTILNIIVPIFYCSIWDGLFRYSFEYKTKKEKYISINNSFLIMVIGTVMYTLFYIVFYFNLYWEYFILIYLYGILIAIQYYYSVIARAMLDNKLFVISGCINTSIVILFNILLILKFSLGIKSLYISNIIGTSVQVLIIEYKIKTFKNFSLNVIKLSIVKKYLLFSIPLTFSAISNWLLNGYTQVYIVKKLGSYYNGLYGVANKFSTLIILLIGVLQFAWNEIAYLISNDLNKKIYYKNFINLIFELSLIGVSVIILLIKLVYPFLINQKYHESLIIIPILLMGTIGNIFAGFLGTIFLADKKVSSLFKTTFVSGIINIIGLTILVPYFKFIGAIFSLAISYFVYSILRLFFLKREIGISLDKKSLFAVIFPLIGILFFYLLDKELEIIYSIIFLLISSSVYKLKLLKLVFDYFKKLKDNKNKIL